MIAYITTQGARVEKEGRRLIVHGKDFKHTLFLASLEQFVIFGNVSITTPAMHALMRNGIDTVFLRFDGRYIGRFAMQEPANVVLRKRQFDLCDDQQRRVEIGKDIVRGKILNQSIVLARIKRARNQPLALQASEKLRRIATEVERATSCNVLRGIEGRAAAVYFAHLHLGFVDNWNFTKRIRRPPTDPVNCLLSFLYTLLTNRCYAAIRQAGLDPQPGILHDLSYGRDSLPLDLVEEFRALIGDTLTLALLNLRVLKKEDFETPPQPKPETIGDAQIMEEKAVMAKALADPLGAMSPNFEPEQDSHGETEGSQQESPGARPILLKKEALKKVLSAFSQKMDTTFYHPVAGKEMSYSEAMLYQARQLRRVIEGTVEKYVPLMLR